MKPSKVQTVLSLTGSLFLLLGVFSKPLGLSETWEWITPIVAIACFVPLIALQRRRRNAQLAAGLPAAEKPPLNAGSVCYSYSSSLHHFLVHCGFPTLAAHCRLRRSL